MSELLKFPKEIIRQCIGKDFNIFDLENLYKSCDIFKKLVEKYFMFNDNIIYVEMGRNRLLKSCFRFLKRQSTYYSPYFIFNRNNLLIQQDVFKTLNINEGLFMVNIKKSEFDHYFSEISVILKIHIDDLCYNYSKNNNFILNYNIHNKDKIKFTYKIDKISFNRSYEIIYMENHTKYILPEKCFKLKLNKTIINSIVSYLKNLKENIEIKINEKVLKFGSDIVIESDIDSNFDEKNEIKQQHKSENLHNFLKFFKFCDIMLYVYQSIIKFEIQQRNMNVKFYLTTL